VPLSKVKKRDDSGRYKSLRGNSKSVESWGFKLMIHITHPRMHLLPLGRVTAHHVHQHRKPQVHLLDGTIRFQPVCRCGVRLLASCLITLDFFGDAVDWDDSICAGGHLATLPLPPRSCFAVVLVFLGEKRYLM